MKKHFLLQNLMILVAFALLIVGFIPGVVTVIQTTTDGTYITDKYSFYSIMGEDSVQGMPWILLTLVMCIGAISFRVTEAQKPLDWVLGSSIFGILCFFLMLFSYKENLVHISVIVPVLFFAEFLLSLLYKIGRHYSYFV